MDLKFLHLIFQAFVLLQRSWRIKWKYFKCKSYKEEERQHFEWCPVYFSKMKLNVMYLGSPLQFVSKGNNFVTLRKSRYLWQIGINMPVLERKSRKPKSLWMEAIQITGLLGTYNTDQLWAKHSQNVIASQNQLDMVGIRSYLWSGIIKVLPEFLSHYLSWCNFC